MANFESHDWEGDEKWKHYFDAAIVNPDPPERLVVKLKHKYYKRYIDESHEIPSQQQQPQQQPRGESGAAPTPAAEPSAPTSTSASSSTKPSPGSSSSSRVRPRVAQGFFSTLHAVTIVTTLLYVVTWSATMYNVALLAFAIACIASAAAQLGLPRVFGPGSGAGFREKIAAMGQEADRWSRNDSAQFVLYTIIFAYIPMMRYTSGFALLLPAFTSGFQLNGALIARGWGGSPTSRVGGWMRQVNALAPREGVLFLATMETAVLLSLVMRLIGPQRDILQLYLYARWAMSRCKTNANVALAWRTLGARIDGVANHRFCPRIIGSAWHRLSAYISS